jgi:hypothetical protein
VPAFVLQNQEALHAYMFHAVDEHQTADLVLGGCARGKGLYFPMFLASLVHELWLQGVQRIRTEISCANTVVLNSYIACGFSVDSVAFDYHLHRQQRS